MRATREIGTSLAYTILPELRSIKGDASATRLSIATLVYSSIQSLSQRSGPLNNFTACKARNAKSVSQFVRRKYTRPDRRITALVFSLPQTAHSLSLQIYLSNVCTQSRHHLLFHVRTYVAQENRQPDTREVRVLIRHHSLANMPFSPSRSIHVLISMRVDIVKSEYIRVDPLSCLAFFR